MHLLISLRVHHLLKKIHSVEIPQQKLHISDSLNLLISSVQEEFHNNSFAGCTWSASDWSCAYHASFMVLFNVYKCSAAQSQEVWNDMSPLSKLLKISFNSILSAPSWSSSLFDKHRDYLRDHLSQYDSVQFPH